MADPSPLDASGDVSVVVVAYRAPEVLTECLESFERHRPRRVREVIVVDNTADPTALPPTTRFGWVRWVRNEENVHFRRGVNQGVALAGGRYVLLLNPDAYLLNGEAVATMAEVLDRDESVGAVGPRTRGDDGLLAPQGERLAGIGFLVSEKLYMNVIWPRNPVRRRHMRASVSREDSGPVDTVAGAALLVRRDEFRALGGFDERVPAYWEEQELGLKLRRRGMHAFYCADAYLYHHWRKGGTEFEPAAVTKGYWGAAMRLYYVRRYGRAGGLLYDTLDALRRAARRLRRG